MSPLMADILRGTLSGEVAIDIVARLPDRRRIEPRLRAIKPDLVMIGLRRNESDAIALTLVRALPQAKIVAFSSDSRLVYVHEMRPHRSVLADLSRDALLAALKP
jgi:chemotaxis response regulator CheB